MTTLKLTMLTDLDEAAVAKLAQTSGWFAAFRRIGVAVRAATALARDPNDTRQVFLLAISIDRPSILQTLAQLSASEDGRALLVERPEISSRAVDYDRLRALSPDTLGGAYVRFLDAHGLDPDMFQRPPGIPIEIAYVAQRIRQTHDLWHVLTGLPTDVPGEIALQAFTRGQLHNRTSWVLSTLGTLLYAFRYPSLLHDVRAWYRSGKSAAFLLSTRWESLWDEPLDAVRGQFGVVSAARSFPGP